MGIPEPIVHTNGSQTGNVTTLTLDEYYDRFGGRLPTYPFRDIEIRISYQELINKGLLLPDGSSRYKLVNFNPRLHYAGHYTLDLDYIEIEDKMHRVLMDNYEDYDSGVGERITDLCPVSYQDMVKGVYTMDEPFQPQFDSYKAVQDMVSLQSVKSMTATYDYQYNNFRMVPGEDIFYDHLDAFSKIVQPKVIMPDIYPIKPETNWNDGLSDNFVQDVLSKKLTGKYRDIKMFYRQNSYLNGVMYPVVQAFGAWVSSPSYTGWASWVLPPAETQKVLQYLPLCYGSDGIFNYRLFGYVGHPAIAHDEYAALTSVGNGTPTIASHPITFNALYEANEKIKLYGPKIKQLNWINALTIKEMSIEPVNTNLSAVLVSSIEDIDTYQTGPYGCHVECGLFMDTDNNPYLMMVNRRANYFNPSGSITAANIVPVASYDTCFPEFDSQIIAVTPDSTAHIRYGTHVGLVDPYDDFLYRASSQAIPIEMQPGDAKLLKMIGTLPELVNAPATLAKDVVLEGDILLANGVNVTVSPNTTLRVKANTHITISSGASFIFRGSVTFEDGSTVTVLPNGSVDFDGANCVWGSLAKVDVVNGSLSVEGGHWDKSADAVVWGGISANSSSTVTIAGATIKNANMHSIHNSNLIITDSKFVVPASRYGLLISNIGTGYATRIENNQSGMGFFGASNQNSKGIVLGRVDNRVVLDNVNFQNLLFGVFKNSNSSYGDSILYCNFTNCLEGLKLTSSEYNANIEYYSFNQNVIGIRLTAANPMIFGCNFTSCTKGIMSELTVLSTGVNSGIFESNFYNGGIGIESRNSNHRIKNNYFNRNQSGIINHSGSNLNLSYGANNVLMNDENNIMFYDSQAYESTIQLFKGHNDFYHLYDDQTNIAANDFSFDTNYYDYPNGRFIKIDASKNWFQDQEIRINEPIYVDYVYVDLFDPNPNMPPPPPENDRLSIALSSESQGLFDQAMEIFKTILDEPLDTEKRFLSCAADGVYRLSNLIADPSWVTTDYFEAKAIQYEIDEPQMSSLLKEYLAKAYLVEKDYQSAIDLIQLRIDNPVSEVDSLLAVLDLEIVLLLADMDDQKKPITTMYVQYKYPDHQVFSVKHDEHWAMLYDLLDKGEISEIYIPKYANITTNYPNPFNPTTTIEFSVPETSQVKLVIYNLRGQKVRDIVNTEMLKGHHKVVWDGKDNNDRSVSSGIFFACLESSRNRSVRKLMLMK